MADESGEVNLTDAEKEPEMTEESGEGNLTNEQREALKQAFCDVDIDGSGSLDIKELRAVLQLIGQNPTEAEIQEFMEGCSEEGSMTQEEFCAFVEEKIPLKSEDEVNEELIEAFKKFDTNEDGTIDRDEFLEIMTKKGEEPLTEAEADELMNKLDTGDENNAPDGKLSIAELGKLFMGSA